MLRCHTTSDYECISGSTNTKKLYDKVYAAETTYLKLAFKVPKRYLYNGDDAAFSINFHPYTRNLSSNVDSRACVTTNKYGYSHQGEPCSQEYNLHERNSLAQNYVEFDSNNNPLPIDYRVYWETDDWDDCFNLLHTRLSWDHFMNSGWAWSEKVSLEEGASTEVRFIAVVETWDHFKTISDESDKFGVLTIENVRPHLFEIPFLLKLVEVNLRKDYGAYHLTYEYTETIENFMNSSEIIYKL